MAASPSSSKSTPGYTSTQFAHDVLAGIGAKPTQGNVDLIYAWIRAEGTSAAFNPLATSQSSPGATNFNSSGVKNYSTYQAGVQATVQTLNNGNYSGIVSDLQKGNVDPYQIVQDNLSEFNTWAYDRGIQAETSYTNNIQANVGGAPPGNVTPFQIAPNFSTGVNDIKGAGEKALGGLAGDVGKYVAYGAAFLGGGLLIITGLLLIGADIGLSVFARTRVAQAGSRIVQAPAARRERKANSDRQARTSARVEQIQESKLKQEKHREALARARARTERARARNLEGTRPHPNPLPKGTHLSGDTKSKTAILSTSTGHKVVNTKTGMEIPY